MQDNSKLEIIFTEIPKMTHTLTVLLTCIAIETSRAPFTVETLCVVHTLKTLPCFRVTVAGRFRVNVVVALAWLACTARHKWVTKVVVGTTIAVWSCNKQCFKVLGYHFDLHQYNALLIQNHKLAVFLI